MFRDLERLSQTYLLPETDASHVRRIQADLSALRPQFWDVIEDQMVQSYIRFESN